MTERHVKVQISAAERVDYSRILEIPESQFEEFNRAVTDGKPESWFSEFADRYLNRTHDVVANAEAALEDVECILLSKQQNPIPWTRSRPTKAKLRH